MASTALRLLRRGNPGDRRPCVYVTGFMTDTRSKENWRDWMDSHAGLESSLGWSAEAYGFPWSTGITGDVAGKWPLPVHTAVLLARSSSPTALVAAAAGDALLNAWRLYLHFRVTEEATVADAERLAEACSIQFGGDGYRIAAHSLGARLVLEAMPLLPPSHRPTEVHLCAAAVTPSRAAPLLPQVTAPHGRLYHYYSEADEALRTGFLLASGGDPALGVGPLPEDVAREARADSIDATPYLGLLAHPAYRTTFARMAADAALRRPPPPPSPRGEWLLQQQAALRETLSGAIAALAERMPATSAAGDRWSWPAAAARGAARSTGSALKSWLQKLPRGLPRRRFR